VLHLTDISKSFGSQVILDQASLHVKPGMRIGLVGPNGAGKTTLLRLIVGDMSLDGGEINARKSLRIGYLPQEIEEIADHAVIDEVLASYGDILAAERRLAELGEALSHAYKGEAVATKQRRCFTNSVPYRPPSRPLRATSWKPGPNPSSAGWAFATMTFADPSPSSPGVGGCGWRSRGY